MYFEDFEIGQQIVTAGRTITEADIVAFAGLSGDYNQLHTDAEFAKQTAFGQRIAHGLLVTSIASGLAAQTGILEGTTIAFREIRDWKFAKPVFIGDTIHVVLEVIATKAMRRLGGGVVDIKVDIRNQHDETVIRGVWSVIMASRP
ncbi:MAG: dehydratase [Chloroflexi bacterium]|nr:dehydratase [Chloroflexota bacterium]